MGTKLPALKLSEPGVLEDAAGNAARSVVTLYREPENRIMLLGMFVGSLFWFAAHPSSKLTPAFIVMMASGLAAREGYRVAQDVHQIARTARGGPDPAQP